MVRQAALGRFLVAARVGLAVLALFASSVVSAQLQDVFLRPTELEDKVRFWRTIFAEYSRNQVVIHDRRHTTIIYKVLDLSEDAKFLTDEEMRLRKRKLADAEKKRLKNIMLSLADNPNTHGLGKDASVIRARLMARGLFNASELRAIADDLRWQSGLREKTRDAIMRSGRYLPYMESIFEHAGLPVLLTRLPLVESSFNNQAYSRSGAAGIWQFMPGTARAYMNFDEVGDERRDPWFSTEAAAKHLSDDYALLQDWPLAITAYNYGRYGMARALDATGATSLVELIENYQHRRWGFAAKNYYAEFLAVIDVERDALKYFGPLRRDAPDEVEEVEIAHYVGYDTLRRISGQAADRFAELNPSFSRAVQRGDLLVPPKKKIRLPRGKAPKFRSAYARLNSSELHQQQKFYFRKHRVRRGDTLSGIARRYGTSIRAIRSANNLRSNNFIRIGQILKVPPGGKNARPSYYSVASGDTLSGIARRYGVSVASLKAANGISDPRYLRAGVRLQIPAGGKFKTSYAYHTIRRGQTVESIARKYGVSVKSIAAANNLRDVHRIRAGQKLKVPRS